MKQKRAEELAERLIEIVQSKGGWESQAKGEFVTEIVAHDFKVKREAADRGIPALCRICEREWGQCPNCNDPCDWKTELRAAILGEGKA